MTVLRQLQTFLLTQHSRDQAALQDYILRALLGVCQVRVFCMFGFQKSTADVARGVLALKFRGVWLFVSGVKRGLWNHVGPLLPQLYDLR